MIKLWPADMLWAEDSRARFRRSGAWGLCRVQIMARLTGCPLVRRQHTRHAGPTPSRPISTSRWSGSGRGRAWRRAWLRAASCRAGAGSAASLLAGRPVSRARGHPDPCPGQVAARRPTRSTAATSRCCRTPGEVLDVIRTAATSVW